MIILAWLFLQLCEFSYFSLFGDGHLKKKDLCVSHDKAENENLILMIRS